MGDNSEKEPLTIRISQSKATQWLALRERGVRHSDEPDMDETAKNISRPVLAIDPKGNTIYWTDGP